MTEKELVDAFILTATNKDRSASEVQAKAFIGLAVSSIGKMTGVDFNRKTVTFSLTSGTASYVIEKDILTGAGHVVNVQDLFRTDEANKPIEIMSVEDFNIYTKGGDSSGAPTVATIDRNIPDELILKVYPIPDSNYPCSATVRIAVSTLQDIPDRFHTAVFTEAINIFNASINPAVAMQVAAQNKNDIRADGYTHYSGGQIQIRRTLDRGRRGRRATSYNLTDN